MADNERKYVPPLAELIDRLTVNQIKEVKMPSIKQAVWEECDRIAHDIDLLARERELALNAAQIGLISALAQLNLHIWMLKDRMEAGEGDYDDQLRLAHQLNGVRNQIKNALLHQCQDVAEGAKRTNVNVDGLEGWQLHVLEHLTG